MRAKPGGWTIEAVDDDGGDQAGHVHWAASSASAPSSMRRLNTAVRCVSREGRHAEGRFGARALTP